MSGQHTPGPWEACEPGDYGDFDGESRVVCGDDQRIAVVHWHPRLNTAESDANARLIAAAPDMLKALTDLVNSFEKHRPKEYWDAARAAIAKATGEA